MKHDVITVRDGSARDSPVLVTYCGSSTVQIPSIVRSSGVSALLEFVSDQTDQRQGFSATFQFVDATDFQAPMTQRPSFVVSSGSDHQLRPTKPSASAIG